MICVLGHELNMDKSVCTVRLICYFLQMTIFILSCPLWGGQTWITLTPLTAERSALHFDRLPLSDWLRRHAGQREAFEKRGRGRYTPGMKQNVCVGKINRCPVQLGSQHQTIQDPTFTSHWVLVSVPASYRRGIWGKQMGAGGYSQHLSHTHTHPPAPSCRVPVWMCKDYIMCV